MKITNCSHRPVVVPCSLETADYQIDPYVGCAHVCHYCYVLNQAETDWTKEILKYEDIAGQLNAELENIAPQSIYMGYYSDPYQPCEVEYRQTRKVLELLVEKGFSVRMLTKSDLVLRDVDLLQKMENASISVSVAFIDNQIREHFEANTIDTDARIEALRKLREAGIHTNAMICPVIPYVTEIKPLIESMAPIADIIRVYGLSIEKRSDLNWRNLENILRELFPDLKEQIGEAVFSRDHQFWNQLRQELETIEKDRHLGLDIHL